MGLHREKEDPYYSMDINYDEDPDELKHRKQVRRLLEDKLERRRLKEELDDELDGEFDWDAYNSKL